MCTRRFARQARAGAQAHVRELGQDGLVDGLDRIVALLVIAVDQPFAGGDLGFANVAPARAVFLLPELAVAQVVGGDPAPRGGQPVRRWHRPVAARQFPVVQPHDRPRIEHALHRFLRRASLGSQCLRLLSRVSSWMSPRRIWRTANRKHCRALPSQP
jgi:hypothetical protein